MIHLIWETTTRARQCASSFTAYKGVEQTLFQTVGALPPYMYPICIPLPSPIRSDHCHAHAFYRALSNLACPKIGPSFPRPFRFPPPVSAAASRPLKPRETPKTPRISREIAMEFLYRAGDERRSRSRSPPPPTPLPPAAASTSGSGSADAHGGGGGNGPFLAPRPQASPVPPPAADSADELRRQAEKARIRERILREEAEQLQLELEVRQEIREELLLRSWAALGRSAAGLGPPVAAPPPARIVSGNAIHLPVAAHEAHPKANTVTTSPAKRKSPDHAAASTVSAATSSKKQKVTLSCMVCGISTNGEKAMQGHVNGKVHKRKVALLELSKPMTEPEAETGNKAGVEALEPSGDYTPTKFMMLTNAGALNEVMQMDGYLLCEVCNVKTADRVTMMCHLEGSKHISKGQKKGQGSSKPPDKAAKKGAKGVSVPEVSTSAFVSADPVTLDPKMYGMPYTVRRLDGSFLCELCNIKALSMSGMQQHLSGKKHKNKANASSDAPVNASTCRKDTPKAQPMGADTAVIAGMSVQEEAPLTKFLEAIVADDSVLQETIAASTKDVTTGDSTKSHGDMKASAAQNNNVCDSDSLTMEVDNVHHPLQRVDGFLVCPCCNVKAPCEIIMQSHLAGKKHKHKRTLAARVNKKSISVLATVADEVQGNSSKSPEANVEEESALMLVPHANNAAAMVQMEVTQALVKPDAHIEPAEDGEITQVQSNSSKSVKADEEAESVPALAAPQAKNATPMAPMEVDGLAEPATRIVPIEDGEIAQLQKNSQKLDKADEETEPAQLLAAPQVKNAAATAPMEVEGPTEVQHVAHVEPTDQNGEITEEVGAEHVADETNGHVTTEAKDSVETSDTAVPGKPIKIQVEGKVFTVLQQENGRLSCDTCGVHGCNKDSMISHLYTRTHWDKANLTQRKKEAAAAVVNNDGCGGSAAGVGSRGALVTTV